MPTTTKAFFDTNVLVYLLEGAEKSQTARQLLRQPITVSVQVLNEFVHVAHRKQKLPMPVVKAFLTDVRGLVDVVPLTLATHDEALAITERYGFGIYDSLIVAAALTAGCRTLYSEDLRHGQLIEGLLRVENPFV